ncbi:MAG: biopolymer transporter ExbD [Halobacteriovoraceae bacterium]|nr:biopolymer transporter ExbD [Halobacteriovoraceae bacterium]
MRSRFNKRHSKNEKNVDIDITSLLDILVILLVFLLRSYNASDLSIDLQEHIELPLSNTRVMGSFGVIVQVNKNKEIWVNNKNIGNITTGSNEIPTLLKKLQDLKQQETEELEMYKRAPANTVNRDKKLTEKINIVLDETLPYEVMQQVMHTAAIAGYPKFKFIVQGDYN